MGHIIYVFVITVIVNVKVIFISGIILGPFLRPVYLYSLT